ncbi:MAG TPA: mechanosensitive ion channel family protein [Thermoanaerobaculia bacterium]|nr:mechanosensitive ion channel family protein [Thermoanaerobaculia bacterium]
MNLVNAWNLLVRKMSGWGRQLYLQLPNIVIAVLALIAFWIVARILRNLVLRLVKRVSHSEQVSWLVSQAVYLALVVAGTFVALGILGLQKTVTSLLAGAGIVGLALGFAFQDIAANFMAGIYLSVRRPFRRGHIVETQDYFGTVHEVNLRWTEIYSQQGQLVLIPNKHVFENPIMNYSALGRRRVDLKVGVSYGEDLARVKEVAVQAIEGVSTRLPERPVDLYFEEFGESSIDLVVRFWVNFSKQPDYLEARSEAIQRLKTAFDQAGIVIPYPVRTLDFGVKGGERLTEVLEEVGVGAGPQSRRRS